MHVRQNKKTGLDMSVSVTVSRPNEKIRLSPNGFREI